jgi:hypothetical protein
MSKNQIGMPQPETSSAGAAKVAIASNASSKADEANRRNSIIKNAVSHPAKKASSSTIKSSASGQQYE